MTTYLAVNAFIPTNDIMGICSFGSCEDPLISKGDPAYRAEKLNIIFHEKCFKNTQMYMEEFLPQNEAAIDIPDDSSELRALQQKSFWARHRTNIILGISVSVAIAAVAIRLVKPEELHTICLQSAENAKELFCCVKEVSSDIATCAFKIFEPVNIWTDAGDLREFNIAELPKTNPELVLL